jgi:hypothetical protein
MKRLAIAIALTATTLVGAAETGPTVGIEGRLVATIPGDPLTATPVTDRAPLIVRVAAVTRTAQGSTYDLRYLGAVAGTYDLRDYLLTPSGGQPTAPALPVTVRSLLPPQDRGELVGIPAAAEPALGGYRRWLIAGAAVWLLALPLLFRRRRNRVAASAPPAPEPTLAERLAELAGRARAGALDARDQARLERLLIAHWRERLSLAELVPSAALARLREHAEAGALLRQVEAWLHARPGTSAAVDVDALLAPYRAAPSLAAHAAAT